MIVMRLISQAQAWMSITKVADRSGNEKWVDDVGSVLARCSTELGNLSLDGPV